MQTIVEQIHGHAHHNHLAATLDLAEQFVNGQVRHLRFSANTFVAHFIDYFRFRCAAL
jgi:hypothetical protein